MYNVPENANIDHIFYGMVSQIQVVKYTLKSPTRMEIQTTNTSTAMQTKVTQLFQVFKCSFRMWRSWGGFLFVLFFHLPRRLASSYTWMLIQFSGNVDNRTTDEYILVMFQIPAGLWTLIFQGSKSGGLDCKTCNLVLLLPVYSISTLLWIELICDKMAYLAEVCDLILIVTCMSDLVCFSCVQYGGGTKKIDGWLFQTGSHWRWALDTNGHRALRTTLQMTLYIQNAAFTFPLTQTHRTGPAKLTQRAWALVPHLDTLGSTIFWGVLYSFLFNAYDLVIVVKLFHLWSLSYYIFMY